MTMSRLELLARRLVMVLGLGVGACAVDAPLPGPAPSSSSDPVTTTGAPGPAATPQPTATSPAAETPKPVETAPPAETPPPVATPPLGHRTRAELEAEANAGLDRLRALKVVEVGGLVLDLPQAATHCYGPCWGEYGDVIAAEYERQLPRLRKLAEIGESVLTRSYPTTDAVERAAPAIAWLEKLEIVSLGDLMTVQPATNPQCYNLPCADDIANARSTNEARSWFVQRWAQMASDLKP